MSKPMSEAGWSPEQWRAFWERRKFLDKQGAVYDDPNQTTMGFGETLNLPGRSKAARDSAQLMLFGR
jgi:hypothetical protein